MRIDATHGFTPLTLFNREKRHTRNWLLLYHVDCGHICRCCQLEYSLRSLSCKTLLFHFGAKIMKPATHWRGFPCSIVIWAKCRDTWGRTFLPIFCRAGQGWHLIGRCRPGQPLFSRLGRGCIIGSVLIFCITGCRLNTSIPSLASNLCYTQSFTV